MRITGPVAPTNPFHIARAYGVQGLNAPAATPAAAVSVGSEVPTRSAAMVSRLVAGVVPGRVDFDAPPGAPGPDRSFELYRRPADRNIAATGVGLGRVIDVSG